MPTTPDESALTLDDADELVTFWLVHLRGAHKAEGTLETYERGVRQFLAYCREQGHAHPIRRRVLSAWLAHLRETQGMQGYTARSRLTAVRQFAKWLLDEGEIEHNPFTRMTQPTVDEKLVEPLTTEQLQAMLATCKSPKGALRERVYIDVRDAALIHVLAETAMRAGEVLALEVDDVRWTEVPPSLIVRRTKTRQGRSVPLRPGAAERISRYLRERRKRPDADRAEFWLSARGGPLRYAGLYDALANGPTRPASKDSTRTACATQGRTAGSRQAAQSRGSWRWPAGVHPRCSTATPALRRPHARLRKPLA